MMSCWCLRNEFKKLTNKYSPAVHSKHSDDSYYFLSPSFSKLLLPLLIHFFSKIKSIREVRYCLVFIIQSGILFMTGCHSFFFFISFNSADGWHMRKFTIICISNWCSNVTKNEKKKKVYQWDREKSMFFSPFHGCGLCLADKRQRKQISTTFSKRVSRYVTQPASI